ncbi:hypothetical protein L210DRAFT_3321067, partial [Boletus edulis BED1]
NVIPVILGNSLPKLMGGEKDNDYYKYVLLLLKPWRSLDDLKAGAQSWSDAFTSAELTPYTRQLLANLNVDTECKDAREHHS